ncbi:MAG: DUF4412 domain-containing protein [Flavobacteriales bacterium]
MRLLLLSLSTAICCTTLTAQVGVEQMTQERMARPGRGMEGLKVEDDNGPFVPNTFIGSFRMEMHRFKGNVEDKDVTNLHYWSSSDKTLSQLELPRTQGRTMKTLTDLKGKWSYTLVSDEKGKRTAMKSHKKKVTYTDEAGEKKPEITVTNETRTIEGHTCTKVIAKSENGLWTGWVTKDINIPFSDMIQGVSGPRRNDDARQWKDVQGFPLEYEWVYNNGTDKMVVYVKDLKPGPMENSVFSLDGYEVMEMPSFGR